MRRARDTVHRTWLERIEDEHKRRSAPVCGATFETITSGVQTCTLPPHPDTIAHAWGTR